MTATASTDCLDGFVRRLSLHSPLSAEDAAAVRALPAMQITRDRLSYLVREGDEPLNCYFLVSGFYERHRTSYSGKKQILNFYVPGDPLNLEVLFGLRADDALQAARRSVVASVPKASLRDLMEQRPALQNAIVRLLLVDASLFREWTLNIGQRDARMRIAHLLCELAFRMEAAGLAVCGSPLPLTQVQISEATSLTSVHVNRTLRAMRAEGLLASSEGFIVFPDWRSLAEIADFTPSYLHMEKNPWHEALVPDQG